MKKTLGLKKTMKEVNKIFKGCEINVESKMTTEQFIQRFRELQDESFTVLKNKNKDYAGVGDPFKNFKLVETLGICNVEQGILVRMCDKMSRISTLLGKEASVQDEKITDTLQDLSNYSLILRVYLEQKNG